MRSNRSHFFTTIIILSTLLIACKPNNPSNSDQDKVAAKDTAQAVVDKNILRSWIKDSLVWPETPTPLAGAILPYKRIVAYYGNPLSKRMGILGEIAPDDMLAKLDSTAKVWEAIDPAHPVQKALHVVMVTAQGGPIDGKYRLRMSHKLMSDILAWANKSNSIVFMDIQVGRSRLQDEIPLLDTFLRMPNVHLGIDAEFAMAPNEIPGRRIGSFDAADVNYASQHLAELVTKYNLPPKVFVVHRFVQRMITNYKNIKLDPRVQIVMHMDGWGDRELKLSSYLHYIKREPVEYTGFKIFYNNDTKCGEPYMQPSELMQFNPLPLYIQYQ